MKLKKLIEGLDNPKKTTGEKASFLEEVKKFNEYGSVIYRTEDLRRVAEEINELVTKAEELTLQETQDWFDEITVKRNIKTLREGNKQFGQTVKEISKLQQRLESLYEEMGHNLGRRPRHRHADLLSPNKPARGFNAQDLAILDPHARDFAVLDQIDPKPIGPARIAPSHRIMAHRATAPLHQRAFDGKARIVKV